MAIDLAKTGHIHYENLKSFLERFGIQKKDDEILSLIRKIDTDNDGEISLKEF